MKLLLPLVVLVAAGCLGDVNRFGRACRVDADCGAGLSCGLESFCVPCGVDGPCVEEEITEGLIFGTGFEDYDVGTIAGQDRWRVERLNGGIEGVAEIQRGTVDAGAQALAILREDADRDETLQAVRPIDLPIDEDFLEVSVRFRTPGLDASPSAHAALMIQGDTGFLAHVTNSGGAGFFMGNFDSQTEAVPFEADVWRLLQLRLDFGLLTVEGLVDGVSLGRIEINPPGGAPTAITVVGMFTRTTLTQDAFFDDLTITDSSTRFE